MKCYLRILFLINLLYISFAIHAAPWSLGPLLADPAQVMPLGTEQLFIGLESNRNFGFYGQNFNFVSTPRYSIDQLQLNYTYGLAKNVDFEIYLNYLRNQNSSQAYSGLGDTLLILGFQLLTQGDNKSGSDVRLTLQEIVPTGRYDQLQKKLYTTDALGIGSYQTALGLSFEHSMHLYDVHYLNVFGCTRLSYASTVRIQGLSAYGGGAGLDGHIAPGNSVIFDLAAEYTITQRWAAVIEGFFLAQQASVFKGRFERDIINKAEQFVQSGSHIIFNRIMPSRHNINGAQGIGSGNLAQFTLCPALEYSLSENIGLIGGPWITVAGKNTPAFISAMAALSITWD